MLPPPSRPPLMLAEHLHSSCYSNRWPTRSPTSACPPCPGDSTGSQAPRGADISPTQPRQWKSLSQNNLSWLWKESKQPGWLLPPPRRQPHLWEHSSLLPCLGPALGVQLQGTADAALCSHFETQLGGKGFPAVAGQGGSRARWGAGHPPPPRLFHRVLCSEAPRRAGPGGRCGQASVQPLRLLPSSPAAAPHCLPLLPEDAEQRFMGSMQFLCAPERKGGETSPSTGAPAASLFIRAGNAVSSGWKLGWGWWPRRSAWGLRVSILPAVAPGNGRVLLQGGNAESWNCSSLAGEQSPAHSPQDVLCWEGSSPWQGLGVRWSQNGPGWKAPQRPSNSKPLPWTGTLLN